MIIPVKGEPDFKLFKTRVSEASKHGLDGECTKTLFSNRQSLFTIKVAENCLEDAPDELAESIVNTLDKILPLEFAVNK